MRSLGFPLVLTLLVSGVLASPEGREAGAPEQITLDGGQSLRLLGQAQRTHLFGTVDLYRLTLYGDGALEVTRLASADVAKALRLDVRYEEDLARRVGFDWRRELVPPLESQAATHLRGSFAPLRRGDVVQIEYVPGRGTTVRVNRGVALSEAHHDLMLAFLDHWLGDRPVSDGIKRALLAGS